MIISITLINNISPIKLLNFNLVSHMGSTNTTPANLGAGVPKKIVVVGFSFAGQNLINAIAKLDTGKSCEITVIDKSDHFEHMPNQFESFVSKDVFIG